MRLKRAELSGCVLTKKGSGEASEQVTLSKVSGGSEAEVYDCLGEMGSAVGTVSVKALRQARTGLTGKEEAA